MKIIIIGGVAAGMSVAAKVSRLDKNSKITVYEKTDIVSWGACGLPYYIGNFFSDSDNMIARTIEDLTESGINIKIRHEVLEVNPFSKTVMIKNLDDNSIFHDNYDKLVISTGAHAIIPPIKNYNLKNVSTLKEFSDGITLKNLLSDNSIQNIIIVGAGYIGLEAVEAMHHLKKQSIRIIQLASRVLTESFDKEITDIMEHELQSYDSIKLHLEETVTEFLDDNGKIISIKTDKGEYPADLVILATGVRPNTSFLKNIGLDMLPNGAIIINNKGMTSLPDIYAAGDCASVYHLVKKADVYIPLATTSNKIGRVVGENLGNLNTNFKGTLASACVKIMRLEAARTGISEEEAKKLGFNYKTIFIKDKNQTSYYPGQSDIWVKLVYDAHTRVILGGQMIGEKGAVLRTDVIATAIFSKMTVDDLGMLDLCYSPPFARTWDVLNIAGNAAK